MNKKTLLTLILLVPFALLVTGNIVIQVLLVIYAGFLIYLSQDKDFMINLRLPDLPGEETKKSVPILPGLSDVRAAEQRVRDDLQKSLSKKLLKKPRTRRKKK